jgi:anti-sigma regulatory factor (Ser/Thr protein kinase)
VLDGAYRDMTRTMPRDLHETWPAVVESVPAARWALTKFAAESGASADQIDAVGLATSEALTNAIMHGYPDGAGTVYITAAVACGELGILIADDGCGIRPDVSRGRPGLGLTLIASLCYELQIVKRSSGGTGLWLWFKLTSDAPVLAAHARRSVDRGERARPSIFSTTTQPVLAISSVSSTGTS